MIFALKVLFIKKLYNYKKNILYMYIQINNYYIHD